MNIVLFACADGAVCPRAGWLKGWIVGLCIRLDEYIGVDREESEKYLGDVDVATRCALFVVDGAFVGRGSAFARQRIAGLLDMVMALNFSSQLCCVVRNLVGL